MTKKRKYTIILIIVTVLFVTILILRNSLMNKQNQNKEYNSLDDFTTPKEVIEYMGGKYISEKKSSDENFYLDIYANFNVDLYTGEKSNEEQYRKMVRIMAYTLKFENFRIADEEKQILIAVICDKESSSISRTYINGDDNYFANQDSKIELSKINKNKITEFNIEAPELIQLINKDWDKNAINLTVQEDFNDYLYFNNGIAIRNVYKKVFNILFREDYLGDVLNGINTKTSLEDVVKILGEPTFGTTEDGLIGYKGNDIYAFFSYETISIYRVENCKTDRLLNILKNFKEQRDVKKFVSSITDMWSDYDTYSYDTQFVNLRYSLKGVKVQFNITSSHGLIVGSNYVGDIEELKKLKEEIGLEEIYFQNIDYVYEAEQNRLDSAKG